MNTETENNNKNKEEESRKKGLGIKLGVGKELNLTPRETRTLLRVSGSIIVVLLSLYLIGKSWGDRKAEEIARNASAQVKEENSNSSPKDTEFVSLNGRADLERKEKGLISENTRLKNRNNELEGEVENLRVERENLWGAARTAKGELNRAKDEVTNFEGKEKLNEILTKEVDSLKNQLAQERNKGEESVNVKDKTTKIPAEGPPKMEESKPDITPEGEVVKKNEEKSPERPKNEHVKENNPKAQPTVPKKKLTKHREVLQKMEPVKPIETKEEIKKKEGHHFKFPWSKDKNESLNEENSTNVNSQ